MIDTDPRHPRLYSTTREYLQLLVELEHDEGIERQISYAADAYRKRHEALQAYLKGGGKPGHENRSTRWREADAAVWACASMLALIIDAHYPSPTGRPDNAVINDLLQRRVGPLCTGWPHDSTVVHPPHVECPVHSHKENTTW